MNDNSIITWDVLNNAYTKLSNIEFGYNIKLKPISLTGLDIPCLNYNILTVHREYEQHTWDTLVYNSILQTEPIIFPSEINKKASDWINNQIADIEVFYSSPGYGNNNYDEEIIMTSIRPGELRRFLYYYNGSLLVY